MKFICILSVLIGFLVNATLVAGEGKSQIITPEEERTIRSVFPDEIKEINDNLTKSSLNRMVAGKIVELIRECRVLLMENVSEKDVAKSSEKIEEKNSKRKTSVDACRSIWTVAIRFVRDTNDEDARSKILEEWNATFSGNDVQMALVQMIALGDVWDLRMVTNQLLVYVRKQAVINTVIIDAFAYAAYKGGDKETLSFLEDVQKDARYILVSIQKALNWSKYKQSEHQGTPGPAESPPVQVDLSKLDTLTSE